MIETAAEATTTTATTKVVSSKVTCIPSSSVDFVCHSQMPFFIVVCWSWLLLIKR
jgi:hypothetical protein